MTIRIPPDVVERLRLRAEQEDRSMAWLLVRYAREGLLRDGQREKHAPSPSPTP